MFQNIVSTFPKHFITATIQPFPNPHPPPQPPSSTPTPILHPNPHPPPQPPSSTPTPILHPNPHPPPQPPSSTPTPILHTAQALRACYTYPYTYVTITAQSSPLCLSTQLCVRRHQNLHLVLPKFIATKRRQISQPNISHHPPTTSLPLT